MFLIDLACVTCLLKSLHTLVEQFFRKINTKFLSDVLKFIKILLVLFLVLNLDLKTFKQSDSGRVVVNTSASLKSLLKHRRSWDKIVRKDVVKNTLDFKKIISLFKFLLESVTMNKEIKKKINWELEKKISLGFYYGYCKELKNKESWNWIQKAEVIENWTIWIRLWDRQWRLWETNNQVSCW